MPPPLARAVPRFLTQRAALAVSLSLALAVWALAAVVIVTDRRERLDDGAAEAGLLAERLAGSIARQVEQADGLLLAVRHMIEDGGAHDDLTALFDDLAGPDHGLAVVHAFGRPGMAAGIPIPDRLRQHHLALHEVGTGAHLTLGNGLVRSQPIRGPNGVTLGAVLLHIAESRLMHEIAGLAPHSALSLSDEATVPADAPAPLDRTDILIARRPVPDLPVAATIGLARADVLAHSGRTTLLVLLCAALATGILGLLATVVLRDRAAMGRLRREAALRRLAERRARRASRFKSDVLATSSHEVRTPLNAIMGLFQLIAQAPEVPERQRQQARAGNSAAGLLLRQLTNMLDLSRLEARSLQIVTRPERLAPLVAEWQEFLDAEIARSGKALTARADIAPDLPDIACIDSRRVTQVVLNLIDNAVKYTTTGSVTLGVGHGDEGLCISITDTGRGIAPQDLERAFDLFDQLDGRPGDRQSDGAGLGLAICKRLAQLMKGNLTAESTPGTGTRFRLFVPVALPAAGPALAVPDAHAIAAPWRARPRA